MNILFLKQISIFSILIGLITGLITLIPFVGNIVFILFFIALSAGMIVYLKRNNILGEVTIKEAGILGAVIGFSSFLAFSCVYMPLSALINFLFNSWIGNVIVACFKSPFTFFVLIFLVIFMALLCALMNGFSGAVTAYVYELLAKLKEDEISQFKDNLINK